MTNTKPYGYIYITVNKINGNKYIGQHSKWKESYLGSGKLLWRAIDKYGIENFEKTIIDYADSKEGLDQLEIQYIKKFNALEDRTFYNVHEGGSGGNTTAGYTEEEKNELREKFKKLSAGSNNPMYGYKFSNEQKKIMANKRKQWFENISEDELNSFREKMREVTSGENNGMFGKKHSEESLKKMSENSIGLTFGDKNGMYGKRGAKSLNGQKVFMYDQNMTLVSTFHTTGLALEFLNVKGHAGLMKACREGNLYKGHYWKKDFSKPHEPKKIVREL